MASFIWILNGTVLSDFHLFLPAGFLTQISHIPHEGTEGNVHTGAPPPWFDLSQGNQLDSTRRPEPSNLKSPKSGKSSRLNPKRVGAAWAERRKLELELEKRGEPLTNTFNPNWLPNFGRVWQSGTRKDSRKEFQMESTLSYKEDVESENRMPLQPYISKKMVKFAFLLSLINSRFVHTPEPDLSWMFSVLFVFPLFVYALVDWGLFDKYFFIYLFYAVFDVSLSARNLYEIIFFNM